MFLPDHLLSTYILHIMQALTKGATLHTSTVLYSLPSDVFHDLASSSIDRAVRRLASSKTVEERTVELR